MDPIIMVEIAKIIQSLAMDWLKINADKAAKSQSSAEAEMAMALKRMELEIQLRELDLELRAAEMCPNRQFMITRI
jgi:hypothetical protein